MANNVIGLQIITIEEFFIYFTLLDYYQLFIRLFLKCIILRLPFYYQNISNDNKQIQLFNLTTQIFINNGRLGVYLQTVLASYCVGGKFDK